MNALNVFPVPDGDTGTNMLLTMQSVDERLQSVDTDSLSKVAQEAARGALFGARGNSGVIFSQFLAGFAQALNDTDAGGPASLAEALASGAEASYSAVSQPVEGTMLTVMREFSESAKGLSTREETDVIALWTEGLRGGRVALENTPSLLPVLKDAGVVDSGGQGVLVIMEGFLCSFQGGDPDLLDIEISAGPATTAGAPLPAVTREFLEAAQSEQYGFCTEFIVEGSGIDLAQARSRLSAMGDSMIVVGDPSLVKVHIHTFDPDGVLAYGASLGKTGGVKVDDINQGHEGFVALHSRRPAAGLAVVSVAWGDGFINLFNDLGCHAVVPCHRTMNPSAQELLEAAERAGAEDVVILPNNSNVILTARQACAIADRKLRFIPTSTLPQGVAALLAHSPELPPDEAARAMESAAKEVRTLEVTTASRDTVMEGVAVKRGQVIALLEGRLISVGASVADVAHEGLLKSEPPDHGLVTIYWGGDAQESQALEALERLKSALPTLEVEAVHGGQPFYHYIASIE